jgi:hypothetical protein
MLNRFQTPYGTLAGHHTGTSPQDESSGALAQTAAQFSFSSTGPFSWDMPAQDGGQLSFGATIQPGIDTFGPYTFAQSLFPSVSADAWSPAASAISPGPSGVGAWITHESPAVVVSTPGSGLVFDNTYGASCSAQFEACIVAAEDQLENLISNSDTITVTFGEANGGAGNALGNTSSGWLVKYSTLRAALLKVAPGDVLPSTDPSNGGSWYVAGAYARLLGLETATGAPDLSVTLNTYYSWDFGQDVINGLTHELSEGGLGRIGGLGGNGSGNWGVMDLFRYNAAGQADYTNGRDGDTTYFSANGGATLSNQNLPNKGAPTLSYNNQYKTDGTQANKGDTADWTQTQVFGSTGGGETLALTQTELDVLQALGWTITLKQDVDATSGAWETFTDWSTGSMPIEAQDAYIDGATVKLDSNVLVNSIATSSSGLLEIGDSSSSTLTAVNGTTLNTGDVSSVASGNLGEIAVFTGSALQIGLVDTSFDNAGTLLLGKGAGGSGAGNLDIAGEVDLSGGGTLTMGGTGTYGDIEDEPGVSGSLVNVNNTITGDGNILIGGSFDNQVGGAVDAQGTFLIDAPGGFTNEGLINDEPGATLYLGHDGTSQSLANTGSVFIDKGADLAISGHYKVTGSGEIGLKGAGAEITSDGQPSTTFTNASIIEAAFSGQIGTGDDSLTFANSGSIAASGSGVTLTIDTGGKSVTNSGSIAAANTATLSIESNLTNTGILTAGATSSSETTPGTLDLGLDSGTASAANSGVIAIYGGSDLAISGSYTVSGAGDIGFKGAGADITSDGNAPATFTNASTIEASNSGQIGDSGIKSSNDLTFINTGSLYASGADVTVTLNTGANTINDSGGLLEAEKQAYLYIDSNIETGAKSIIEASSAGLVLVYGTLSGSGTLSAGSGSQIDLAGGGSFAGAITGAGQVDIGGATTLTAGASLSVAHVAETADLTLASASITNAAGSLFTIYAISDPTVTIDSTGTGSFTNAGSLAVDIDGTAVISAPFTNTGTVSVILGTLQIAGALAGSGTLSAGPGAVIDLESGGTLTETISGAGTLQLDSATYTLAGATIAAGTVHVDAGAGLSGHGTLAGALADSGAVTASGGSLLEKGALSGAGTLSAVSGEELEVSGGGSFAGAISGAGKVVVAKAITLSAGATLSTAELLAEANVTLASVSVTNTAADHVVLYASTGTTVTLGATGTGAFTNLGTFVAEDTGTALISAPFVNDGLAEVTAGTLVIAGALSGTGKLSTSAGTVLDLKSGGTLSQGISGAGTLQLDGATYSLSANTVTTGTVKVDAGAGLSGHGTLTGALAVSGMVTASGGTLLESGALSGTGTLSAASGEELEESGGGTFAGAITGAGKVVVAKAITLDAGASLSTASLIAEANLTLASVSLTNTAADRFVLYASTGGTVALGATGTGAFINQGSFVAEEPGSAVVSAAFTNSGTVSAQAGTLSFIASVGGTGTMDISAAATLSLELGAGSGQVVDFLSTSGALDLTNPLDFTGTIKGFGSSDQVFLENTTFTSFGYSNNILTIKDGTSTVASLNITETSNHFSLTNETHGVLITFT